MIYQKWISYLSEDSQEKSVKNTSTEQYIYTYISYILVYNCYVWLTGTGSNGAFITSGKCETLIRRKPRGNVLVKQRVDILWGFRYWVRTTCSILIVFMLGKFICFVLSLAFFYQSKRFHSDLFLQIRPDVLCVLICALTIGRRHQQIKRYM